MIKFDRKKHVFISPNFEEIIKDTIRFFNGTPVMPLPVPEKFHGTGVYALYSIAKDGIYKDYHLINRTSYNVPIYVGKAVPHGWRLARTKKTSNKFSYELHNRLRQHGQSINAGEGLSRANFHCRFMILDGAESNLIGTVEASLIRTYRPIWNTLLDGFGNHDPGKGRYEQARSDWDVCHPGRLWAEKCHGEYNDKRVLLRKIQKFMVDLRKKNLE